MNHLLLPCTDALYTGRRHHGLLLFDHHGVTMRSVVLTAVVLFFIVSCVAAEVPAGVAGTRPGDGDSPTEVTVGLYLIDVSKVDGADQSFTADLFVLLRWHDPRLEGLFDTTQRVPVNEVWNPRLQILNRRSLDTTFPDLAEIEPDGTVVTRQRYFGTFSAPFDLHDFPLDRQSFTIRLVVPGYLPDEVTLAAAPVETSTGGRRETFSIADWDIGPVEQRAEPFKISPTGASIPGYTLLFEGRRHLGFWAGKAFVSVAIIVAMSWIVFWLSPKFVAPRLSVAVTSMLTLIAYRFLLGAVLPKLSYLTRMDFFLIGATLLVLITVVQVAVTTHLDDRDRSRNAARLNRHSRWVFPLAFLVLMAVSFWTV